MLHFPLHISAFPEARHVLGTLGHVVSRVLRSKTSTKTPELNRPKKKKPQWRHPTRPEDSLDTKTPDYSGQKTKKKQKPRGK